MSYISHLITVSAQDNLGVHSHFSESVIVDMYLHPLVLLFCSLQSEKQKKRSQRRKSAGGFIKNDWELLGLYLICIKSVFNLYLIYPIVPNHF